MAEIFAIAVVVAFVLSLKGSGNKTWEDAAARTKLEFSNGFFEGKSLRGRLRGLDVKVFEVKQGNSEKQLVAEVRGVDPGFSLAPERGLASLILRDIETGDRDFDAQVRITGDPDFALPMLGQRVRRVATAVVGAEGAVDDRKIRVPLDHLGQASSRLGTMLTLAELLRRPSFREFPKLLAEQALKDPSPGVRLRAFRQLLASKSRGPLVRSLAIKLLGVRDAALGLEAGRVLLGVPERSAAAAKTLIRIASGRHLDPSVRVSALEALAASRERPAALPTMSEILRRPDDSVDVRRASLKGLIRARQSAELLAIRPEGAEEAQLLAEGLGQLDGAAQPRLLELLGHASGRVRAAAATSLGRVGDVSSMAALHEVAEGGFFKAAEARAAAEAMERIKGRAGASQAGEISIVAQAPLEGAVSPADEDETGGEV
ncbi:MAG: hypothetical protein AAFY88_22690, partial [Acidobacteriota bacterium]